MKKLFLINFNSSFLIINLLILFFLLMNGKDAPLFNLDFSDWYLDKSQRIANDFKQFKIPGFDYASHNGWNNTHGSIPINHIMVFLNLFFSPHTSAQIFIFLTDLLIYFSFFLLLKNYFKFNSILASFFSFLIFILLINFNENYIVNQYTLFGFLVLINFLLTEKNNNFYFGIILLPLYCSFSYPPYNVPLAPFFHFIFIFIFFFKEKILMKKLLFWFFVIWISYFLYHSSLIISLIENYHLSNRSLFERGINNEIYKFNLKDPLYVLLLIIIYALSKNKIKDLTISIIIIFIPEIISFLPIDGNFIINRFSYSSPLLLIFHIIFIFKNQKNIDSNILVAKKNNKYLLFLIIYNLFFIFTINNSNFKSSYLIIIPIIFILYFFIFYDFKNFTKIIVIISTVFLFKFTSILGEGYKNGFLYIDQFNYPVPKKNYRIVSLNDHCFETIFNSSQVLIKGHKTLDGNSVFYPIDFAKKIKMIKSEYDSCNELNKFKYWNNRVFFTYEEFIKNKNLLDFFIDNNVRIIRSRHKIENDNLKLLGEFKFYNTSFIRYKLNEINFFKSIINKYVNNFENKKVNVYIYEINYWKKIDLLSENNQDEYVIYKILNFYIFIIFFLSLIFSRIFTKII